MVSNDYEENKKCILADEKSKNLEDGKNLNFKKRLIFQVRRHRSLYDNTHKLFSNVAKKDLVWQQIAKILKSNVNDCKDTWFELRYGYQRHARRLRNYFVHGHKGSRKRPAMCLESQLMFLWRFIDNRKTCKIPFEIPLENEIVGPEIEEVDTESQKTLEPAKYIAKTDVIEKEIESNREEDISQNKTPMDDDLILVEQPVEVIVIDEDDDNGKSEKQFKLSTTMKMLILQIKTYPELYDSEHSSFKDYTRKSYVWNAIAGNLGDKATKLMKCWVVMQTRYEWEVCQAKQNANNTASPSDLQIQLDFIKKFILNNPDTVYKQSYYLKRAWFDPIDYFKDIYNLIVRMKKMSDIVYITDSLLKTPEKSKQYLSLWSDIGNLKGNTAGQCETTWLIMRHFYWEIMYMRQQSYQLTDKWYFETIITELYAISKAAQTAKQQELQVLKQNKPTKKASKRAAQANANLQGAPSNKRSSPPTTTITKTTIQMAPTIINNLQNVPATTMTTQSRTGTPLSFPKITAAISLAPQALNTGSLQIKQISGPPALSPAPQPRTVPNGTATTAATSTPVVSTQMTMSFNLPTQTKVTPIQMPPLIRPLVPANTQPMVRSTAQAVISVRPRSMVRPPQSKIQITPWTMPSTTTANSVVSPQTTVNLQTSQTSTSVGCKNSNTPPTSTIPAKAIASFKITTMSLNSKATNSTNPPLVHNTTSTMVNTLSSTPTNTSQLPKITGATSLLNANEILIELIASQNGNQLVVHGPPLTEKYQLSMPTVAKFIREVLAIPLLHNKRNNQPSLINYYWEHIGKKFNLPVHICRACWNFLLENFNHFPQIAPLKDLMKPFQTTLNVWKISLTLFNKFDKHCVSKGWLQYKERLPEVVECVSGYPVLYQDISKQSSAENVSDMETLCAWRTISLRFPKIPEIQEIWVAFKVCFCQYMTDLEFGIDNKWPLNWWRSLARLKFLVEARYTQNEPFYYIVSNKMVEEIEKCAMMEMKNRYKPEQLPLNTDYEKTISESEMDVNPAKNNDTITSLMASIAKNKKEVELGALITAIQKHPVIYGKADNIAKYEAWKKVAQELHMGVSDCLLAFQHATEMYFAYKKQDPVNRCRINERYYKKFDEIVRSLPSLKGSSNRGKLNIKTPFELNQSLESEDPSNDTDLVFPERYISDISMSNSPSNLVVKNWVFALGNIHHLSDSSSIKLKDILKKYLSNIK